MAFPGPAAQYRYPIGYDAYLMYVAMWAQRFLLETGQGPEDLGAVAVAQRAWAADNPRAVKRQPLSLDEYLAAPLVVEPFRADDCTTEVDGACAVLVTSLERARDLRHPPASVASWAYRAGPRSGLDIGDHLLWRDYTRNYTTYLRDELFAGRASCRPTSRSPRSTTASRAPSSWASKGSASPDGESPAGSCAAAAPPARDGYR